MIDNGSNVALVNKKLFVIDITIGTMVHKPTKKRSRLPRMWNALNSEQS